MLRLLAKKKSFFTAPIKPIFRSVVHPRQNFFSNTFLDEGEYIEGDFDTSAASSTTQPQTSINAFKKKFIDLENFENNLVRKTPRPKAESKKGITNSVANLKDKLKFELAADDEFAQSLKRRQKVQEVAPKEKVPEPKQAQVKNQENLLRAAIDKASKGKSAAELEEKNLTKIEFKEVTPEAKEFHPVRIYQNNHVKQMISQVDQSGEALEEFRKGEEGVDYIHPGESLTKAYADVHHEMIHELAEKNSQEITNKRDRELLNEWRLEMGASHFDLTGFEDDPIQYPGSRKGPHPNDDPDFFVDWLFTNMPAGMREFYREVEEDSPEDRDSLDSHAVRSEGFESIITTDVPNSEMFYTRPEYNFIRDDSGYGIVHSPVEKEMNGIAIMPDFIDEDYQAAQLTLEKWTMFRLYPVVNQMMRAIHTTIDDINNGRIQGDERRIHSLFRYYNLLPEFVRKNPIIINAVRCLEFSKHDMTLEQKEIALNMACEFTIPLTAYEEECYAEGIISTKRDYSIWEERTLLRLDEDKDIAKDKKRNVVPLALMDMKILDKVPENAQEMKNWNYPQRLDPHIPEEDPHPVLPLDFYDNDDGFWDDYINYKEQAMGSFPLLNRRPYFKH